MSTRFAGGHPLWTHTDDRNSAATDVAVTANGPAWHYASIQYQGRLMSLLIETDDEDVARREAEEICESFGDQAILLSVTKVVLQ